MTTTKKAQIETKHIVMLLDRSGSMSSSWPATLESVNGYIDDLKGQKASLSLITFDGKAIETVFAHRLMKESSPKHITNRTISPRSSTPLNDAVGRTIKDMESVLDGREEDVLITIMTDGYENASTTYSTPAIKKLIEEKQGDGWVFTYLGANQDAWGVAEAMGIPQGNAARYSYTDSGVNNLRSVRMVLTAAFMRSNLSSLERTEMMSSFTTAGGVLAGDDLDPERQ